MSDFQRKNTRGKIEILASILFHCRNGIRKTHIMCRANLGYHQLSYYLPLLINTNLIVQLIENGSLIYRTTDDGREFLEFYYKIVELICHENAHKIGVSCGYSLYQQHKAKMSSSLISMLDETQT